MEAKLGGMWSEDMERWEAMENQVEIGLVVYGVVGSSY